MKDETSSEYWNQPLLQGILHMLHICSLVFDKEAERHAGAEWAVLPSALGSSVNLIKNGVLQGLVASIL